MRGQRKKFFSQLKEPKVKRKLVLLIFLVVLYSINLYFFSQKMMSYQESETETMETGHEYNIHTVYISKGY